jgi:glycosyltransferase involved in cell wall biosynthesis
VNIAINTRLLLAKGHKEGIARYTFEITKRLVALYPHHQFYFFFDRPYSNEYIFADNVKPIIVKPQARHPFLFYLWYEWTVPYYLKKYKIDVFFSPDNFCSLSTSVRQVLTVHDIIYNILPETIPFLTRKYYQYYMPMYVRKANHIVAVSKSVKNDIIAAYPDLDINKINTIYNALPSSFQGVKDAHNRPISKRYFVVVGSINPRKNTERILQAFQLLQDRVEERLKIVVIGSVMWRNQSTSKIWKTLHDNGKLIHIQGASDEEVFNYIAHAEALIFASLYEGFGFPILEGWASSVPVITSDNSSMKEIGGDAVILTNPYDVNDISHKMELILNDVSLSSKMISEGRNALKKFSWDVAAAKIGQIITGSTQL